MKITFIGATHEVTGSCYYLEAAGHKFLVDCGMEQGPDYYENAEIPVALGEIEFVLLTHAHIDHSGNLPAIYAKGFRGPVYATDATSHLCDIMLRDSAHIQMFEAEWRNRKGRRQGKPEFVPAYTMEDAMGVIRNFVGCPYNKMITPAEGISARFIDAGHLLGSASIELTIREEDTEKKIVFSGDIGNTCQPLIKDPEYLHHADYIVMESTYGDRSHGEKPDYVKLLSEIIQETFDRGGNLVIPSFAVGRTQEMLYFIRQIKADGLVYGHDGFKVYVDSPLANEATTIYSEHQYDSFCKLVLVCEMKDYKKMILRKMAKEILFSELMLIHGYDLEHKKAGQEEIKDIFSIKVMGFDITIKNMLIAEAVLSLTEKGRNIVLMSFFLGMTDKEIGKMLHLGQSTVNYHKNNNMKKMRKLVWNHLLWWYNIVTNSACPFGVY